MVSSLLSERGVWINIKKSLWEVCRKGLRTLGEGRHFLFDDRIWGSDHNRISMSWANPPQNIGRTTSKEIWREDPFVRYRFVFKGKKQQQQLDSQGKMKVQVCGLTFKVSPSWRHNEEELESFTKALLKYACHLFNFKDPCFLSLPRKIGYC